MEEENIQKTEAQNDALENEVVSNGSQENNSETNLPKEDMKGFIAPPGVAAKMYVNHFGVIFSNLALVFVLLSMASFIGIMIVVIHYILLFMLMLLTFGLIFFIVPDFWSYFSSTGDFIAKLGEFMSKVLPYAVVLALAFSIASLVCLVCNKGNYNIPRIVFSCIIIGISFVFVITLIVGALK